MYIPIMKNRDEELRVLENSNEFFNDSIIPLIEIIKDKHTPQYQKDLVTGEFIREKKKGKDGKTRNFKVKLPPTENDIITLSDLNRILNGKKAFIDFFRYTDAEYNNQNFKGIELSIRLSRDYDYYFKRLITIGEFQNFIPVISIKDNFKISKYDLLNLITELRNQSTCIAIRFTDKFLDDYSDFFETYLTEDDYLMLDIRQQNIDSKFIELGEFEELETPSKKILLNSPRSVEIINSEYECFAYTKKIDNSAAIKYKTYSLDGFGDFGGLKDTLPSDEEIDIFGTALGLIYDETKNAFYSILNTDSRLIGMKGFKYVAEQILLRAHYFDPSNNCKAIERIRLMTNKYGNWGTWNYITLIRYIQQRTKSSIP